MSEPTPEQIKAGVLAAYEFDLETQPYADMVRAIYTAMRTLERPSDEAVERVARIIDPDAWDARLPIDGCGVYWTQRRIKAYVKARAAIAAMQEQSK